MSGACLSRRRFIRAGGLLFALPLLPSLAKSGLAAPSQAPKRFIFIFTANGQRPANWYPNQPQAWKVLSSSQFVRETSLTGTGGISPILGPEFDSLKPKLNLFRGLDCISREGGGHNARWPLSGHQTGQAVTIDQILAQSSKVYASPPVRSIHMMIKPGFQSETTVSVSNTGGVLTEVPHETSVPTSFNRLFGGYTDEVDPIEQQRAALKSTVMDRIRGQYEALRQHPRLGAEDKKRLEAHFELIQDLQSRLGVIGPACTKPNTPEALDDQIVDNLPAITTLNVDLLAAAIKCDRTRVATLMLSAGSDIRDFPWLPGHPGDHHGLSHDAVYSPESEQALAKINNWYAQQVADLLTKLDVVEDPTTGATYLDNSIVYWGNEDGCNFGDAHYQTAMPVLLAGSAGGYFKTGRYLDYRRATGPDGMEEGEPILYDAGDGPGTIPTDFKGRPYNALLISILRAMGLSPEDYETAGQPGFGGYGGNYMDQYSIADGQQELPFLAA